MAWPPKHLKNITVGKRYKGEFLYQISPSDKYLFYSIHNMIDDDEAIEIVKEIYEKNQNEIILLEVKDEIEFIEGRPGFLIRFKFKGRDESEKIHEICSHYDDLQFQLHHYSIIPGVLRFTMYECIFKLGDIKMKPKTREHFGDIFSNLEGRSFSDIANSIIEEARNNGKAILKEKIKHNEYIFKLNPPYDGVHDYVRVVHNRVYNPAKDKSTISEIYAIDKKNKDGGIKYGSLLMTLGGLYPLEGVLKRFSRDQGNGYEIIVPPKMKEKTKEHFGDIFDNIG